MGILIFASQILSYGGCSYLFYFLFLCKVSNIILIAVGESSSSSYMRRSSAVVVDQLQPRKKVLGSRPPTCVNKCMSCRPCMATLVIPPHRIRTSSITTTTTTQAYQQSSSFHREDDSYYLLSWKCKCGDKLFQP